MLDEGFAETPSPPYWAVIFSSRHSGDDTGYAAMAGRMLALARRQPGFLGVESSRDTDGFGITVSYWRNEESIAAWRADTEHRLARRLGAERWYSHFEVRVAKVERAYGKAALPSP